MDESLENGSMRPDKDSLMELAVTKITALQAESATSNHNGMEDSQTAEDDMGLAEKDHIQETTNGEEGHSGVDNGEENDRTNGSELNDVCNDVAESMDTSVNTKPASESVDKPHDSPLAGLVDDRSRAGTEVSGESMDENSRLTSEGVSGDVSLDENSQAELIESTGKQDSEMGVDSEDDNIKESKDEVNSSDNPVNVTSGTQSDSKEPGRKAEEVDGTGSAVDSGPKPLTDIVAEEKSDTSVIDLDTESVGSEKGDKSENGKSQDSVASEQVHKTEQGKGNHGDKKVEKLLDDDGDEFIITVNEDESDHDDKEVGVVKTDQPVKKVDSPTSKQTPNSSVARSLLADSNNKVQAPATKTNVSTVVFPVGPNQPFRLQSTPNITTGIMPYAMVSQQQLGPRMAVSQTTQQTGYITKVGSQTIFVPMPKVVQGQSLMNTRSKQNVILTSSEGQQPQQSITPNSQQPSIMEVTPKSSLDMIELMKWELQNRVPDNYNWSVVFHHRKDSELSNVTSFLLELGHDVVKESVYKDIIHIQTKKKELGKLKDGEIESLEKMKSVYEDTRKKVEHLHMNTEKCGKCKFSSESSLALDLHKDYPHIDPPNDVTHGTLVCSHCDFTTKQAAAFAFHMEACHNLKAKLMEKYEAFRCELCPFETNSKNKLTKHRFKCSKHFKLQTNLQPYFHDVNFVLRNIYYKPKRPPPPKPVPEKPKPKTVPVRPPLQTMIQQRPPQNNLAARLITTSAPSGMNSTVLIKQGAIAPATQARSILQNKQVTVQRTPAPSATKPITLLNAKPQQTPPRKPDMSGFEVCELCGGYVKDRQALRIHFYYAHKVEMPLAIFNRPTPPLLCEVCQSRFWTTQGLSKHKSSLRHYGPAANSVTSPNNQQCFMCLRRVPNLFVHVEQVHGMTMKDLVVMKKCIMCGLTAADRRQLEVHMASQHGVLIKANDFLGQDKGPSTTAGKGPAHPTAATVSKSGGKSSLVRNNLCVFCQVQFQDNIQLTMHCIKNHATCNACGMVVASSKHLQSHSCKKRTKDCHVCGIKRLSVDAYNVHIAKHVKPCKIRLQRMLQKDIDKAIRKVKEDSKPQVICLDSDDDSDDGGQVPAVDNDKLKKLEQLQVQPVLSDDNADEDSCSSAPKEKNKSSSSEKPEKVDSKHNHIVVDVDDTEKKSDDQESRKQENKADDQEQHEESMDSEPQDEQLSESRGSRKRSVSDNEDGELSETESQSKRQKLEADDDSAASSQDENSVDGNSSESMAIDENDGTCI